MVIPSRESMDLASRLNLYNLGSFSKTPEKSKKLWEEILNYVGISACVTANSDTTITVNGDDQYLDDVRRLFEDSKRITRTGTEFEAEVKRIEGLLNSVKAKYKH